ncbi:magnesium transporter [Reichenbachiella agariperforans]|uniref:Magnesium transporter MgtE n=1 Tax=Reichenbachiella agariperforans TaxID=156994 RepID=A0A1M6UMG6_REIAG|nr:magnesium transporter [Reichenbachiella agariperforans]SHK70349.1 magnesium transporter [Reichenbachiella agariperforans]
MSEATEIMDFELSKEFLERFVQAVEEQEVDFIQQSLDGVNPADITELLEEFDADDSKYVLELLDPQVGARVIIELEDDLQSRFMGNFTSEETAVYIDNLDSDDGVGVLNLLPISKREEVIALVENEEKAGHLLDLLRYEDDVAGGLMGKELIKANHNWTIQRCIEEIRKQAENVQKIYSVYVVDDNTKLIGKVSLKKIILSEDNARIADIYDDEVISVETYVQEEEVAQIMRKYDLEALPVVNVRGKLVGRITIDDVLDVITEQAEEDIQMMSGISSDVEEDDSVWIISKARLPWLVIGLVGGLLGAKFISLFEAQIAIIPAMAFFIPLITATGGNVGIQSSTIIVQGLANSSAFSDSVFRRLIKMLMVALVNGTILAIIVFGIVIFTTSDQTIAITVSSALFSVVLLASFMGTITPLILHRFGVNPAIASGPFITTANDLLGLAVYFFVANQLYGL